MMASKVYRGRLHTFQYSWLLLLALSTWQWAYAAPLPQVELHTSQGVLTLELNTEKAPQSVVNFLDYARSGFYNQTLFHRVIKGYMIQGGGFDVDLNKKLTQSPIKNEADNGLKNLKGTVVMARRGNPDSATSQFFINLKDNPELDHREKTRRGWGYAVFGQVVSGMDVLEKVAALDISAQDKFRFLPLEPVIIEKIIIHNDVKRSAAAAKANEATNEEDEAAEEELASEEDEAAEDEAASEEDEAAEEELANEEDEAAEDEATSEEDEAAEEELASEEDEAAEEELANEEDEAAEEELASEEEDNTEDAATNAPLLPEYSPEPPDVPAVE